MSAGIVWFDAFDNIASALALSTNLLFYISDTRPSGYDLATFRNEMWNHNYNHNETTEFAKEPVYPTDHQ